MEAFVILVMVVQALCQTPLPPRPYHRTVGIPLLEQIKAAEEAGDSDGLKSRTWGGTYTKLGQYPYVAGLLITLLSQRKSMCGGALITKDRLLTAAHCGLDGLDRAILFEVVLGSLTLMTGGHRIQTDCIMLHRGYHSYPVQNDIAIIVIPTVTISANIDTIELPFGQYMTDDLVNFSVYVIGYGTYTIANTSYFNHFEQQAANLLVINNTVCSEKANRTYDKSWICTDVFDDAHLRGTCHSDAGAPLILPVHSGEPVLIGLHAYNSYDGCQEHLLTTVQPNRYTRVSFFMKWIRDRMEEQDVINFNNKIKDIEFEPSEEIAS